MCPQGLRYLHKSGVIHRDVKAGNLLLTDQAVIKICEYNIIYSIYIVYDIIRECEKLVKSAQNIFCKDLRAFLYCYCENFLLIYGFVHSRTCIVSTQQ